MGSKNKTDKLDARAGYSLSQTEHFRKSGFRRRNCDLRGLMRARLSAFSYYGAEEPNSCSGMELQRASRPTGLLAKRPLARWPSAIRRRKRMAAMHEWELLDDVEQHIGEMEAHTGTDRAHRLGTSAARPCREWAVQAATIHLEIRRRAAFPTAAHLASYAGLVPATCQRRQVASRITFPQAIIILRWAFVEAANCILMHRHRLWDIMH